jgi:hypothetical protein
VATVYQKGHFHRSGALCFHQREESHNQTARGLNSQVKHWAKWGHLHIQDKSQFNKRVKFMKKKFAIMNTKFSPFLHSVELPSCFRKKKIPKLVSHSPVEQAFIPWDHKLGNHNTRDLLVIAYQQRVCRYPCSARRACDTSYPSCHWKIEIQRKVTKKSYNWVQTPLNCYHC